MRWLLKPCKTDPSGERRFENTFLVDGDRNVICTEISISSLPKISGYKDHWDLINMPLLAEPDSENEITIANFINYKAEKVKAAGLSPQPDFLEPQLTSIRKWVVP